MADYSRSAFKPKTNTALKKEDIERGSNPLLWSIEDIIEVYGGFPRAINNQTVLRYKIDLQAILDKEKKTLLDEIKNNIDKEIENKLLHKETEIRKDIFEKQAPLHHQRHPYVGMGGNDTFGIKLINEFLNKIKGIDFNTDMRLFELDDTKPYAKNATTGGRTKKGRKGRSKSRTSRSRSSRSSRKSHRNKTKKNTF